MIRIPATVIFPGPTRAFTFSLAITLAVATMASCSDSPQQVPPSTTENPTDTVHEWAALDRYKAANASLGTAATDDNRVILFGDSITEGWAPLFDEMFPGKAYLGRGISGQTTAQMLVRFRQDVLDLRPDVVVILAGTNDIAGNTGVVTLAHIQGNLASMAELASSAGIGVILSSVLPVADYPWRPGLEPAPKIVALNDWMRGYAESNQLFYVDYHGAMADARDGMRPELAEDGVHPNRAGYSIMAPLVEEAIAAVLRSRTNGQTP